VPKPWRLKHLQTWTLTEWCAAKVTFPGIISCLAKTMCKKGFVKITLFQSRFKFCIAHEHCFSTCSDLRKSFSIVLRQEMYVSFSRLFRVILLMFIPFMVYNFCSYYNVNRDFRWNNLTLSFFPISLAFFLFQENCRHYFVLYIVLSISVQSLLMHIYSDTYAYI